MATWSRISQAAASGSRKTARLGGQIVGQHVEVALGQGEEFGERAGMLDDAQHGAVGAMASQTLAAPLALRAGQIDLAHDALADQAGRIGLHHLGDEFVAGRAGEAVVAALKLEIGIADAGGQQAQQRKALGARRRGTCAR